MQVASIERELGPAREGLEQRSVTLNPTQWRAWERALSRRLTLIWGPPGTGKSRTARAVILGAALEAHQQGRRLRVLACAQNYNAMDNVLLDVNERIGNLLSEEGYEVHRLRSHLRRREDTTPEAIDTEVNRHNPTQRVWELLSRLYGEGGVTIVGSTPYQVYNLLKVGGDLAQQELFDLILIDEASQMDVPLSILPIASLADGGSVVLAGDPKQLPPIQQAEAPLRLEAMVGAVYAFCEYLHGVEAVMLDENYRSNGTLVNFSLEAGYRRTLSSYSPNLRLSLASLLPTDRPDDWPRRLYWTPEWPHSSTQRTQPRASSTRKAAAASGTSSRPTR
jgi:DNA replication ATP-dependent helicase Dna2